MRVSSNQILEAGVQSMNNSLADAMEWQKKIGTGNNYSKASDNPYAVSRGVRLDFDVDRLEMYKTNQNYVASSHAIAQSQMSTIIDELIVIKQAYVQSQNGALNSANFKALKIQIEQIRDTIKSQMTAKDATGNPIFPETVNNVQIEPNVTVKSGVLYSDISGNYLKSKATNTYDLSSSPILKSGDTLKIGTVTFTAAADTTGISLAEQFANYLNNATPGSSGSFANTGLGNVITGWAGPAIASSGQLTLSASVEGSVSTVLGKATKLDAGGSIANAFTQGTISSRAINQYNLSTLTLNPGDSIKIGTITFTAVETTAGSSLSEQLQNYVNSGTAGITGNITNTNLTPPSSFYNASNNSGVLTLTRKIDGDLQSEGNATIKRFSSIDSRFTDGGVDVTGSVLYKKINDFVTYLDQRATGSALTNSAGTVESGLNDIFDRITTAQQRSGGIAAQVDISKEAMSKIGTEMAATASALLDTNLAEATAEYTRSQTLLNAAQAMFARLQQSSLFSKL
jgi:flagellin-like hook-associated protein FlgL